MSGLVKSGWDVSCITQSDFKMDGVKVVTLPKTPDPLQYSKEVTKIVNQISPDIVECSNWKFELLDYSQISDRKSKLIVRFDPPASTLFGESGLPLERYEKQLCENADQTICVSKFCQKELIEKYKIEKSVVVYNGIDIDNILELKTTSPVITLNKDKINIFWCGKTTKMKGFDLLLPIINISQNKIHWILNIGNSIEEVGLEKFDESIVTIIKNVPRNTQIGYWKACDMFLTTSRTEGFCLALGEALTLGLPSIVNSECEVFKEFKPNKFIHYSDCHSPKTILSEILTTDNTQKKSSTTQLNSQFSSEEMIINSINVYNNL